MAYKSDNLKGTCFKSVKCTATPVPELFPAGKRLTSQIFAKAANSKEPLAKPQEMASWQ